MSAAISDVIRATQFPRTKPACDAASSRRARARARTRQRAVYYGDAVANGFKGESQSASRGGVKRRERFANDRAEIERSGDADARGN